MHDPQQRDNAWWARGTSWVIAAVLAWTVNPVVLLITIWPTGVGRGCSSADPAGEPPPGCPREGLVWLAGMAMLAAWILLTALVGLAFGVVEGANRRFAKGYLVPAILITVAAPWAMAGFAIGVGLGRLLAAAKAESRR